MIKKTAMVSLFVGLACSQNTAETSPSSIGAGGANGGAAGGASIASGGTAGWTGPGSAGAPGGDRLCGNYQTCPSGEWCVIPALGPATCKPSIPPGGRVYCSLPAEKVTCADDTYCARFGGTCDRASNTCVCVTPVCEPGPKSCNVDPTLSFGAGFCGPGRNCHCAAYMLKDYATDKCAVAPDAVAGAYHPCTDSSCDGKVTTCSGNGFSSYCHLVPPDCVTKMTCACACPDISSGICGAGTTGCTCVEGAAGPVVTCHGA